VDRDGRPITILMAEDDAEDRLLAKEALAQSRLANDLRFVEDGEQLVDYLNHRGRYADIADSPKPGLILLDLNMPKKDGREALREIKVDPQLRRIPVVVLTSSKAEEDIFRTYDLGANSFIIKPVSFQGLVEVMKSLKRSWYGLSKEEAYGLFGDLSRACPDVRMVHYNNPNQRWYFTADDYLRAREVAPNLIGTKSVSWDYGEIVDLIRRTPEMTHFFSEAVLLPAMLAGAKGSYSSAFYFHPGTTLRLYDAIVEGRYVEAMDITASFVEYLRSTEEVFNRYQVNDAAYDKLIAHLSGFLQMSPNLRSPYKQLPDEGIDELKQVIRRFPEWDWSASSQA